MSLATKNHRRSASSKKKKVDVPTALIHSAKALFASKGWAGTSVKSIADAAGVNVAMISYYFDGKESLYKKCLEDFATHNLKLARKILSPANSSEGVKIKLEMFADEVMEAYLHDQDLVTLIQRECDFGASKIHNYFREIIMPTFEVLQNFLVDAKDKKLISESIDPQMAALLFWGLLLNWTRRSKAYRESLGISFDDPEYRKSFLDHIVYIFLNGVFPKAKEMKNENRFA